MESTEKIKIIQYHNNLLGFDCPCVLRASGKFEIHDQSRMPKDEAELESWLVEMVNDIESKEWLGNRKSEYIKEGCTIEALTVALFEHIVEGRPEPAEAIQKKRLAVKGKWAKPG